MGNILEELSADTMTACPHCDGWGVTEDGFSCPKCSGTGSVWTREDSV